MAPPRKRSRRVLYGVVGALVLACSGGFFYDRYAQRKECVDPATQLVVDDDYCERDSNHYRWYYGGRSSGHGTKATGGSYERGGFGRMFSGGGGG